MENRKFEYVPTPPEIGKVVAICNYRGHVIVACEWGLMKFKPDEQTLHMININGAAAWVRE